MRIFYKAGILGVHVFRSSLRNFASNNASALIRVSIVCFFPILETSTSMRSLRGVTFCVFFTPRSISLSLSWGVSFLWFFTPHSLYSLYSILPYSYTIRNLSEWGYTWYRTVHKPLTVVRRRPSLSPSLVGRFPRFSPSVVVRRGWLVGWIKF